MTSQTEKHNFSSFRSVVLRALKILGWSLAVLLSIVMALLLTLWLTWQSSSGRVWLVDRAGGVLSQISGLQLTWQGLSSPAVGEWYLDRAHLKYAGNALLSVEQLRLHWSPAALWQGELQVASLTAYRLVQGPGPWPQSPDQKDSEGSQTPWWQGVSQWPASIELPLASIHIQHVDIQQLQLLPASSASPVTSPATKADLSLWRYRLQGQAQLRTDQSSSVQLQLIPAVDNVGDQSVGASSQSLEFALVPLEQLDSGLLVTLSAPAGLAHWQSQPLRITAHGQMNNADWVATHLGVRGRYHGLIRLQAEVSRKGDDLHLRLDNSEWQLNEVAGERHFHSQLNGHWRFDTQEPALYTEQAQWLYQGQPHPIDVTWTPAGVSGEVTLKQLPLALASLWLEDDLSGELSAQVKAAWQQQALNWSASLQTQVNYHQQLLTVQGSAAGVDALVESHRVTVETGAAKLESSGEFNLNTQRGDWRWHARNVHSEQVLDWPLPIANYLPQALRTTPWQLSVHSLDARLRGAISDPSGKVTVDASGHWNHEPMQLQAQLQSRLLSHQDSQHNFQQDQHQQQSTQAGKPRRQFEFESVRLTWPATQTDEGQTATATLQGSLRENAAQSEWLADLQLQASDMPTSLATMLGADVPVGFTATVNTDIALTGPIRQWLQWHLRGDLSLAGQYQDGSQEIPFSAEVDGDYRRGVTRVNKLQWEVRDNTVLEGSLTYQRDAIEGQFTSRKLPLELLSLFGLPYQRGHMDAFLTVSGKPDLPDIEGSVDIQRQVSVQAEPADSENRAVQLWSAEWQTDNDSLQLQGQFAESSIEAEQALGRWQASLNYAQLVSRWQSLNTPSLQQLPWHLEMTGQVPLQVASLWLDNDIHQLGGNLVTDLDITVEQGEPSLQGQVRIEQGEYRHTGNSISVNNMECVLAANNRTLTIQSCRAEDGRGEATLGGYLRLPYESDTVNDKGDVQLQVVTRGVGFIPRRDMSGELSGDLTVSGDRERLLVAGNINIDRLEANIGQSGNADIPQLTVRRVEDDGDQQGGESALPEVALDVRIESQQQAYLRGRGLDSELAGYIQLSGTATDPHYSGQFQVVRGHIDIFGRRFKLTQGSVAVANKVATLSISGEYQKDDLTIRLNVNGTNKDVKLSLSSTPYMAEDEILAYLIFGKSIHNISPFEAVRIASAVQTLRGESSRLDDFLSASKKQLGVDAITIESGTNSNGGTGVNVGVSKYLSESVYLELQRTSDDANPWRHIINIQLTPRLTLQGYSGGGESSEGVELQWRKDY